MIFDKTYTTQEKIDADPKENKKTILSNDAYAITEFLAFLIKKIEHTRKSLIR